jgi:hypothetical protein
MIGGAFCASGAEGALNLEAAKRDAAAITAEKYPDADAVLVDDEISVRYQPDGTSERRDETLIKVLTEKGKRENRMLSLHFDTAYGTNYFERVEVIKPDGRTIPVHLEQQSRVMVDPAQMGSNIYDPHSKVLQVAVPMLDIGDMLHYVAVERKVKTVVPDTWSDYQVFESTMPIHHLSYQITAPLERPLKHRVLKAEIPGTVEAHATTNGNEIVYRWEVARVPQLFPEPNMTPAYTVSQRLLVSTIDSWETLSKWYWALCEPHLNATTPEMEEMVDELTAHATNRMEKIRALFNFVSQDIRYMGITAEDEAPGYEPHDVCLTFENRYGVCRDKAALLASMLRLADIEAFPVIIMVGPKKDAEVPQPFFNHAVTAALDEHGNYILMDSTDETP